MISYFIFFLLLLIIFHGRVVCILNMMLLIFDIKSRYNRYRWWIYHFSDSQQTNDSEVNLYNNSKRQTYTEKKISWDSTHASNRSLNDIFRIKIFVYFGSTCICPCDKYNLRTGNRDLFLFNSNTTQYANIAHMSIDVLDLGFNNPTCSANSKSRAAIFMISL